MNTHFWDCEVHKASHSPKIGMAELTLAVRTFQRDRLQCTTKTKTKTFSIHHHAFVMDGWMTSHTCRVLVKKKIIRQECQQQPAE